eukprot:m.60892 g.60892  ORF g.60892 m.60892 type:complete len:389 (+) comp34949_c0_seq15:450-1616(+)
MKRKEESRAEERRGEERRESLRRSSPRAGTDDESQDARYVPYPENPMHPIPSMDSVDLAGEIQPPFPPRRASSSLSSSLPFALHSPPQCKSPSGQGYIDFREISSKPPLPSPWSQEEKPETDEKQQERETRNPMYMPMSQDYVPMSLSREPAKGEHIYDMSDLPVVSNSGSQQEPNQRQCRHGSLQGTESRPNQPPFAEVGRFYQSESRPGAPIQRDSSLSQEAIDVGVLDDPRSKSLQYCLEKLPRLEMEKLKFVNKIAEGNFGIVYQGVYRIGNISVAAKMLKKDYEERDLSDMAKEAYILNQLNHPNIVRFYGLGWHETSPVLVLELLETGALDDHLQVALGAPALSVVLTLTGHSLDCKRRKISEAVDPLHLRRTCCNGVSVTA